MRRSRLGLILAILALALVLIFLGFRFFNQEDNNKEISNDLVSYYLAQSKDLTTSKFHYTNVANFEESDSVRNRNVLFTKTNFLVSYEGVLHAGIDLEEAEVQVSGQEVRIILPQAKILAHSIDDNSLEIIDSTAPVFNQLQIEEVTDFVRSQKETVEAEAIEKDFLAEAQHQAVLAIDSLLGPVLNEISDGEVQLIITTK